VVIDPLGQHEAIQPGADLAPGADLLGAGLGTRLDASSRAAPHRLQSTYKRHPSWTTSWDSLCDDPSVEFFRRERDSILKEAPPQIGRKLFMPSIGPGGIHIDGYSPASADEFYYFDGPETPATVTVRRHFDAYEKVPTDAERRFADASYLL